MLNIVKISFKARKSSLILFLNSGSFASSIKLASKLYKIYLATRLFFYKNKKNQFLHSQKIHR